MLTAMADRYVLPVFSDLHLRALQVATASQQIQQRGAVTEEEVVALREIVGRLMLSWQRVYTFDFGPADGPFGSMVMNVGTFPVNTSALEAFVAAADTSFQNFQRDTRGLCALDYLLFAESAANTAVKLSGSQAAHRRNYLCAVANTIVREVQVVYTAWQGSYRAQFVSRAGTDAGSSVSLVFNTLNIGFEVLKNYKLGLPLGKRVGQTGPEPTRVEFYYNGASIETMRAQFAACVDVWRGLAADGSSYPSFKAYLATVANGSRLIADTEEQIAKVQAQFDAVGTTVPLSTLVVDNPAAVEPLFVELQKLTRFWKSEMSSLLGISITYSSGDGD